MAGLICSIGLNSPQIKTTAFISALIYSFLILNYFIWVFGMGEAAIRIRLLRELDQRPDKSATLEELLQNYNSQIIVDQRLDRLVGAGHLKFENGYYRIGNPVLLIELLLLHCLKSLMGISESTSLDNHRTPNRMRP